MRLKVAQLGANKLKSRVVNINTSPTEIIFDSDVNMAYIQNAGAGDAYIGGSDVSIANGFKLQAGDRILLTVAKGLSVFVVSDATAEIRILELKEV